VSSGTPIFTTETGVQVPIAFSGSMDPATGTDNGAIQINPGPGIGGIRGDGNFVVQINPVNGSFEVTIAGKTY
jgi:hypothetical protein